MPGAPSTWMRPRGLILALAVAIAAVALLVGLLPGGRRHASARQPTAPSEAAAPPPAGIQGAVPMSVASSAPDSLSASSSTGAAVQPSVDPEYASMFSGSSASSTGPPFWLLDNTNAKALAGGGAGTGASLLGLKSCFPKTGAELVKAVESHTDCPLVILTTDAATRDGLTVPRVMNVTAPLKVIVGNPIELPAIKPAKTAERLFNVLPGARLDLRSVCLFRGGGRALNNGQTKLVVGGVARVYLGGVLRGAGVVFREARGTLESFMNELRNPTVAKRTFGGMVFVMGGDFTCYGCQIVRFNPYGAPDTNQIQVGGNFLVVMGNCACIGCYNVGFQLFSSGINVGSNAAVLGGTLNWIGGGGSSATLAVGQFGVGQTNFVGGGVLVMVGYQDISVLLAIGRAGMGQHATAAGVLMMIGQLEDRAWAVGGVFNAGQTYSCGSGILQMHGGEVMNFQISVIQAVNGGSGFVGSGDLGYIGMVYGTFGTTFSQHGLGMRWSSNAGLLENILINGISTAVVRSQFILGSESYLGTGFFSSINQTRYSMQVVNAAFGGHEYWVGPGAAAFIKTYSYTFRVINYRTNPYSWVAAGTYIAGSYKATNTTPAVVTNRGGNIYVNKTGVYAVSKNGTVLLPPVAPPTKQAQKAAKRNESIPHVGVPVHELPHHVVGPIGAGGSGGSPGGDQYMAASIDGTAPSPTPRKNSILVTDSVQETRKMSRPDSRRFQRHLARRTERRRLAVAAAGAHPSSAMQRPLSRGAAAADVVAAFKATFDVESRQGRALGEEENQIWPEYIYAHGADTACLLCGLQPLPSSSHVAPDGTALDTAWWLQHDNGTDPAALAAAAAASTPIPRAAMQQQPVEAAASGSCPCRVSDSCAGAASPQEALARAEVIAAPDPLTLPPGVVPLLSKLGGGGSGSKVRRTQQQQRQQRRRAALPMPMPSRADEQQQQQQQQQQQPLPDAYLFWRRLALQCPEGGCGLSAAGLKAALKAHLLASNSTTAASAFKLTVAGASVPDAALEALEPEELDTASPLGRRLLEEGDASCPRVDEFVVYVLTREDEATARALAQALDALEEEDENGGLLSVLGPSSAACAAAVGAGGASFLPSIDKPAGVSFYQQRHVMRDGAGADEERRLRRLLGGRRRPDDDGDERGLLGLGGDVAAEAWAPPSVTLLSSTDVAPVGRVHPGSVFQVVLKGFDPRVDEVVVELVRGLRSQGEEILTVPKQLGGDGGDGGAGRVVTLEWAADAVEESDAPSPRAFLYARYRNVPGVFAFSTPFTVVVSQ